MRIIKELVATGSRMLELLGGLRHRVTRASLHVDKETEGKSLTQLAGVQGIQLRSTPY